MIERLTAANLLDNGNDLVVHRDRTVYVTVPAGIFKLAREPILRAEYSKVIRSEADGSWSIVAHLAGYTNGVELVGDDLVVSTSRGGKIYRFPRTAVELRNLEPETTFGEMHDNFTQDDDLLVLATHPEGRRFLQHAAHPGARSPSQVWRLDPQSSDWSPSMIFEDDGSLVSGASTAACVDGNLILGQVFGPSVLSCSDVCPPTASAEPEGDAERTRSQDAEQSGTGSETDGETSPVEETTS